MFVDKKTKLERLAICSRCGKCSCFLDAKTSLKADWYGKCPEGKW